MAFMLAACTYGFGQHIANITTPNRLMTMKVRWKLSLAAALYVYVVVTES